MNFPTLRKKKREREKEDKHSLSAYLIVLLHLILRKQCEVDGNPNTRIGRKKMSHRENTGNTSKFSGYTIIYIEYKTEILLDSEVSDCFMIL